MIEEIRLLPLPERVMLFMATVFWLAAFYVRVMRNPVVDAESTAMAIRQLRLAFWIGLASLASLAAFLILHFVLG